MCRRLIVDIWFVANNMAEKSPHVLIKVPASCFFVPSSDKKKLPGCVAADTVEKVQTSNHKYPVLMPQPLLENTTKYQCD